MPEKSPVLFLNPTAGRGRAGKRQPRILQILQSGGVDVELQNSSAVGDLEERVCDAVRAGVRRVLVAGGDGSIHEAINGILRGGASARLGVIPTGTGNDFAKACGISLNWEHTSQLLAERIESTQASRKIDIGRCNDRFFGNGVGIGFDAEVTRIARSIRLPIGDIVYLIAVFRAMLSGVSTPTVTLSADNVDWHAPMTLANVSNGAWVGGMFHIAPPADNTDGMFDLVLAKPVSRRRIMALLPKLLRGTHLDEHDILHHPVRQLHLRSEGPLSSHLDGEVQPQQSSFDIELLPGALELI